MAVNHKSGRVVVDVELELKMALHGALAAKGLSLKDWFKEQATAFVVDHHQPKLTFVREPMATRSGGSE